jgi:hypothetical protein
MEARAAIDATPAECSEEREAREQALNAGRELLIRLLNERVSLLDQEIASIQARVGPNPICSPDHPGCEALGGQLVRLEAERRDHLHQLEPLRRWQMRQEIGSIDQQIAEIDQEVAGLGPACDPGNPRAELLAVRRQALEQRKQSLVQALTSSATEFEQWDPRWGAIRYGTSPNCTNIQAAGCGPTSLAIVLNYLYQEDPESLASQGGFEIVTPPQTATYAATHGRVCNSGTSGDTMVTQIGSGFPGYAGQRITLEQTVAELRQANLVIFLCHGCTGNTRSGGTKHYGGHFMVLRSVDSTGRTFSVLDPGAGETRDIETISRTELGAHASGFWKLSRM